MGINSLNLFKTKYLSVVNYNNLKLVRAIKQIMEFPSGQNIHDDDDRKDIEHFEDLNRNFQNIPNIDPNLGVRNVYTHSSKWRKDSEIIMSDNLF